MESDPTDGASASAKLSMVDKVSAWRRDAAGNALFVYGLIAASVIAGIDQLSKW